MGRPTEALEAGAKITQVLTFVGSYKTCFLLAAEDANQEVQRTWLEWTLLGRKVV